MSPSPPADDLRGAWRSSIETIAKLNAGLSPLPAMTIEPLRQEQAKSWAEWDAEQGRRHAERGRRLMRVAPVDREYLLDCVLFMAWAEYTTLTRRPVVGQAAPPAELPALQVRHLRQYLETRRSLYSPVAVDEFVDSLFSRRLLLDEPTQRPVDRVLTGDLRLWLGSQRYDSETIEHQLWELERDEQFTRRMADAEATTVRGARDERRSRASWKREATWERQDGESLAGLPSLLQGWAAIISAELIVGSCECHERYETRMRTEQRSQCEESHFLSQENLLAARQGGSRRYKNPLLDPLEFVQRAVVWSLELVYRTAVVDAHTGARERKYEFGPFHDFGKSLLAQHVITPGGCTLRRKKAHETQNGKRSYPLMESPRHDQLSYYQSSHIDESKPRLCLRCALCDSFFGGARTESSCASHDHVWYAGWRWPNDARPADEPAAVSVATELNVCANGHFWPARRNGPRRCAACDLQPKKNEKVDVFVPTRDDLDEITWDPRFVDE